MELLTSWARAFAALWMSPFYYLSILFVVWQVRKQIVMERRLFSVRLHSWRGEIWRILLWGAAAGAMSTAIFAFVGAELSPVVLYFLWIIALLLSVVRVRFLCFAYAAGVLGLLQASALLLPEPALPTGTVQQLYTELLNADMPSVVAFVAILHLAEAGLAVWQGARLATPLFLEGKRGKLVGGYHLQGLWPVPMLLPVSWEAIGDWTVLAFPVIIGFSTMTTRLLPAAAARRSGWRLALFGLAALILAAVAALAEVPAAFAGLAAVCVAGLHELVHAWGRMDESRGSPQFVHDGRGLKVLAVLPKSAAAELGIEAGDIVHKVNGQRVSDKAELHAAMRINAAFTKLEVLNREGHSKFMQRALFANEHHQLGIILCPDEQVLYCAEARGGGLFSFLRSKRTGWTDAPSPAGSSSDGAITM